MGVARYQLLNLCPQPWGDKCKEREWDLPTRELAGAWNWSAALVRTHLASSSVNRGHKLEKASVVSVGRSPGWAPTAAGQETFTHGSWVTAQVAPGRNLPRACSLQHAGSQPASSRLSS